MTDVQTFGRREPDRPYRVRPAAYAVILDEAQRVACVVEGSGLFLPGGGIEAGEDPRRAVHREVAEECGRELEIIAPLGVAVQFLVTTNGEAFELRASFFLARFGNGPGTGDLEVRWLSAIPELPGLFHECHRWAVSEAVRHHEATGAITPEMLR